LHFGLEPWEAGDSRYYGAALAALAVGATPESYRGAPDVRRGLELLREYLNREYARQSLSNRTAFLWASTAWPGVMDDGCRSALIAELLAAQRDDGGWSLASMARTWSGSTLRGYLRSWVRKDWTLVERQSDGYATAFATLVLEEAGVPNDHPQLTR